MKRFKTPFDEKLSFVSLLILTLILFGALLLALIKAIIPLGVTQRIVDVPNYVTVTATNTAYVTVEIPHCADEKMAVEQAVKVIGTLPFCGMVNENSAKSTDWCNDCLPAADNESAPGACPMQWSEFLKYNR